MARHRHLLKNSSLVISLATLFVVVSVTTSLADAVTLTLDSEYTQQAVKKKTTKELTNFWVSTGGSDVSGDGTESAPFLTIARAQLAVRQARFRRKRTLRVNIEPGTYTLT